MPTTTIAMDIGATNGITNLVGFSPILNLLSGTQGSFDSVIGGITFTLSTEPLSSVFVDAGGFRDEAEFTGHAVVLDVAGGSSVFFNGLTVQGVSTVGPGPRAVTLFDHSGNTLAVFADPYLTGSTWAFPVAFHSIRFSSSNTGTSMVFDSLAVNITCYLSGTRIATPDGAVAVEDLQAGDKVLTADGREVTMQWLGRQEIDPRFEQPAKVNPICISAHAIADNVPSRDLYVSRDHAIEIDGMLINASVLVNGSTIYQVASMPLDGFTYYHVETDAHELILAENCPSESYLDIPDRSSFVNGAERDGAPLIREMDMPRISTRRLVPESVSARLSAVADARVPARMLA